MLELLDRAAETVGVDIGDPPNEPLLLRQIWDDDIGGLVYWETCFVICIRIFNFCFRCCYGRFMGTPWGTCHLTGRSVAEP